MRIPTASFRRIFGLACVIGLTLTGLLNYLIKPDHEKAQKVLQDSGFTDVVFSKLPLIAGVERAAANCARATTPGIASVVFSANFNSASKNGEKFSGTVCFDRKQEKAEIVFNRKIIVQETHPNIVAQLKK